MQGGEAGFYQYTLKLIVLQGLISQSSDLVYKLKGA